MTPPKPIPTPLRRATPMALLAVVCVVAGCGPVGAVLYKLTPEPEIPARYKLLDVPTVVLVENFRTPDLMANDAELVARSLQDELTKSKIKLTLVKTEKILDLRNNRPKDYPTMSVPQIAQAVGAEQVVYVDLQGGGVGSLTGQSMFQGKASALVKVIDGKTGVTAWPPDSVEGVGVSYETNPITGKNEGSYAAVRSQLYEGLAKRVGRLFHAWKASEDDDERGPSL